MFGDVLLLGGRERPDFVHLYAASLYAPDLFIMEGRARLPSVHQQLGDRIDRHVGHARNRPHGRPLAEHGEDLDAGFEGQLVHAIILA